MPINLKFTESMEFELFKSEQDSSTMNIINSLHVQKKAGFIFKTFGGNRLHPKNGLAA